MEMVGEYFENRVIAGRLKSYSKQWEKLTSDRSILEAVNGYKLEFLAGPIIQKFIPFPIKMSEQEKVAVNLEINKLLKKGVIIECEHENDEFISTIFTRPQKDGNLRMILNLKQLNCGIEYHHFKMDTFLSSLKLVTPGCYMASIDLRDAYYSVPIAEEDQKFLKFIWDGNLYKFTCLPNGLSSGPRVFTKILKPPFSLLRQSGYTIVGYIDDTLLLGDTITQTDRAVKETTSLLTQLGFIVHKEKSVFIPSQEIVFLGFVINSVNMTVKLTPTKIAEVLLVVEQLRAKSQMKIEEVASVVGKLVAAFPGVAYGPLHYRELEKVKIAALSRSKGNFSATMTLNKEAKDELTWWLDNLQSAEGVVTRRRPDLYIETDASGKGWGAYDGSNRIGGRWNEEEMGRAAGNEINFLELWAGFLALRAFCTNMYGVHVQLKMDNTTAIAYVNHMGGIKARDCNALAIEIWEFCIERNIWLSAVHLPGVQNVIADRLSREFNEQVEWRLNRGFEGLCNMFGTPEIDLFASRLNAQLPRFVSWKPDPDAEAIDALGLCWTDMFFYAFPPFCLVGHCLQKVMMDEAEGLMILPMWPTQTWYSRIGHMLVSDPVLLPRTKSLLTNVMTGASHPLLPKLQLMCCRVSGRGLRCRDYRNQPSTSSSPPGVRVPENSIGIQLKSGSHFVREGELIRYKQM